MHLIAPTWLAPNGHVTLYRHVFSCNRFTSLAPSCSARCPAPHFIGFSSYTWSNHEFLLVVWSTCGFSPWFAATSFIGILCKWNQLGPNLIIRLNPPNTVLFLNFAVLINFCAAESTSTMCTLANFAACFDFLELKLVPLVTHLVKNWQLEAQFKTFPSNFMVRLACCFNRFYFTFYMHLTMLCHIFSI